MHTWLQLPATGAAKKLVLLAAELDTAKRLLADSKLGTTTAC
jgi:hypothetical protein